MTVRAPRKDRKASDAAIVKLNAVGLSSRTIAKMLGIHPTTISNRLKKLNISAIDTRRSFMEDVINSLAPAQKNWLVEQVGPHNTILQYVTSLIVSDFINKTQGTKE